MRDERTSFRERSAWPGWATAIYWGAILACCYPLIAGWDTDLDFGPRLMIAGGVMAFAVLMMLIVGGLTVLVQETRVVIHLGSVPLVRKVVSFDDIVSTESVRYSPFKEFGGWGVRGFGKKRAWTSSGDQAVVLTLADDTRLYVGSGHPQRLEERIRSAAGDRIG